MATTANETLKKQFELLQQQQLAKLERRRKLKEEKEDKLKAGATNGVAVNGSFGVEDNLGLKLSEPPPPSETTVSEELVEHLNDQLRELKDENGRLYKLLSERDFEIKQLKKKREDDQLALAGSLGVASDAAASRIVELSKKVRELTASLEAKKTEAKQLSAKCISLENQIEASNVQSGSPRYLAPAPASSEGVDQQRPTEVDYRALQEKLKQTELKVAEYRNQVQSLRQDLKVAQKVIANEVGEGITIQELLNSSSNWRGRAQQILALQKKISEMKGQLEQASTTASEAGLRSGRNSDYDLEAEFMGASAQRQRADERHRDAVRKLEKDRKEALERAAAELKALEEDYAALKQKFDASKARNKTLSDEIKQSRDQVKRLEEKGKHDNELIEALIAREVHMKQMIEDITKLQQTSQDKQIQKMTELSLKVQHDTNTVDRLKTIVEQKEARIQELLREVSLLKQEHLYDGRAQSSTDSIDRMTPQQQQPIALNSGTHMATSRHGTVTIESRSSSTIMGSDRLPSRRTPLSFAAASGSQTEREIDLQQSRSLAQAAQVERDKLMELVNVMQKRLDEASEALLQAQSELKQQKQKCVLLEKQVGRLKVGTAQRKTNDKNKTKSAGFDNFDTPALRNDEAVAGAIDELETMLAIQRDENEALKAALQSTLEAKENDLKLYNEMLGETKAVFLQGLRQFRQQLQQ